jgi:hypothetical protein
MSKNFFFLSGKGFSLSLVFLPVTLQRDATTIDLYLGRRQEIKKKGDCS